MAGYLPARQVGLRGFCRAGLHLSWHMFLEASMPHFGLTSAMFPPKSVHLTPFYCAACSVLCKDVFPNEASCLRLVSALLIETSEEWQIEKRSCAGKSFDG